MKLKHFFKMNKKAVAGLEFMKEFAVSLFVVVIMFFALAVAGGNLQNATSDSTAIALIQNFTTGLATLGASIPTWIVLASLVVLIAILSVVIMIVARINTGSGEGGAL